MSRLSIDPYGGWPEGEATVLMCPNGHEWPTTSRRNLNGFDQPDCPECGEWWRSGRRPTDDELEVPA